ncbi:UNKNOWN [Stylonychia lemnae]|uniref:Uncharacterized protein n=1 Tax=Stylonychia lemnae TaxID=5949 RepID=A0A078APK1_STYLE|nr:UNKNOWN [Stylonychia lemnae]|eukprot:CDW82863.1 UNKNOWN [Stylonychia lemnae]
MSTEFEKESNLSAEEAKVKTWLNQQYENLKDMKSQTADEMFKNIDSRQIQKQIKSQNEKLNEEMRQQEFSNNNLTFSEASQHLGSMLIQMIEHDRKDPAKYFRTSLDPALKIDNDQFHEILNDLLSRLSDVQLQSAKKVLHRYKHDKRKVTTGIQTEVEDEMTLYFQRNRISTLKKDVSILNDKLEENQQIHQFLIKENHEINTKHTKINERFRELSNKYDLLETKYQNQIQENMTISSQKNIVEQRLHEVTNTYQELRNNLETTLKDALNLKKDRKSLINELFYIGSKFQVVKVPQVFYKLGIQNFEEDLEEEDPNREDSESDGQAKDVIEQAQDDSFELSEISSQVSNIEQTDDNIEKSVNNASKIQRKTILKIGNQKHIEGNPEKVKPDKLSNQNDLLKRRTTQINVDTLQRQRRKEKEEVDQIKLKLQQEIDNLKRELEKQNKPIKDNQQMPVNENVQFKTQKIFDNAQYQQSVNPIVERKVIIKEFTPEKRRQESMRIINKDCASIGVQFPDQNMLKMRETLKMIHRKELRTKMIQTEDLVDEELLRQLKEQKAKYGLKIFATKSSDMAMNNNSQVQFKSTAIYNKVPPEYILESKRSNRNDEESYDMVQNNPIYNNKIFIPRQTQRSIVIDKSLSPERSKNKITKNTEHVKQSN